MNGIQNHYDYFFQDWVIFGDGHHGEDVGLDYDVEIKDFELFNKLNGFENSLGKKLVKN